MGKESIGYLQESTKCISWNKKYFSKDSVSLCITFRIFPKVSFLLNCHAATESTAATYTEKTTRKKSCVNNLLYDSWKHF